MADDTNTAKREAVARAIWALMREHEDRCDEELEDLNRDHPIWAYADAARASVSANACGESAAHSELFEYLRAELSAIPCRYRGDPSYDHDAYWMRDKVEKLIDEAERIFPGASLAASAGSEAVAAIYQLSPPASAHDTITEVIKELRTYNPQADEHGGRFIHKGWANQLEAVAPPQISESGAAYWVRNRALILRAIEERGFRLVSSGGLFWLSGPSHPSPPEGAGAEQALRKVLSVVQRYLPPDGPSAHDAMSEITAIVDPWPLGPLEKP